MKVISTLAVAAVLAAGGIAVAPAAAQKAAKAQKDAAPAAAPARKYNIGKEARKPISDLQAAVTAKNTAGFAPLLAAAEAVAKNSDEKYVIARLRLEHAVNINDPAAQRAAIEAILASGGADAAEQVRMKQGLAGLASQSGDFAAAESSFAGIVAAEPNNLDAVVNLARAKLELKKDVEALPLLQRAITLSKAQGRPGEEAWYRKALEIAHKQRNRPLALQLSRDVLTAYPTEVNLRNAIIIYRDGATLDKEADLDMLRLMRAGKVMSGPGAYMELAQVLNEAGLPGEAKSVLEEGTRLGLLKGGAGASLLASLNGRISEDRGSLPGVDSKARAAGNGALAMKTATAYMGYGDYAKAADLYRVALQKGGVDANLVNTRLGMALAMGGQKAEAQAAFKAVTGARADLATLWLAWLAQRA
jgi:tetratricopeptide (TPR) repeat protein